MQRTLFGDDKRYSGDNKELVGYYCPQNEGASEKQLNGV